MNLPNRPRLNPDRLFPADERTRTIARQLHETVATAPIISPHSHVDPKLLVANEPFSDPAELFITHDHYVTRLLHAAGHNLMELGLTPLGDDPQHGHGREIWRVFCANWHLFAGTASGYWVQTALADVFDIGLTLSEETADALFDEISSRLTEPAFRPRALLERFRIDVLATTDDPMSDLSEHHTLTQDDTFKARVIPTFRPDAYIDPRHPHFYNSITRLANAYSADATDYTAYLDALRLRREHFIRHGAVSADHGVVEPYTAELDAEEAATLYRSAVAGKLDAAGARRFAGHMLFQMARMSVNDGLVMTVHAGVHRNHHSATLRKFGPDTGNDIPVATEFVHNLHPVLERFGDDPQFHLVLFTVDETTFSREIATLAGFYPSVYIGAPWWFLDAPDAVTRFRSAVTETAGFYRGSGFIDDTRAFLSIPARHDMSRRLDAAFLARLVAEGRVDFDMAHRIISDLVLHQPREVFKL